MDEGDGTKPGHHSGRVGGLGARLARIVLRLVVVIAIALAASRLITFGMDLAEHLPDSSQGPMQAAVILTALLVYALLIATPFVPGVEIGLALLVLRGASIAPAVYVATLLGLLLAFFVGRVVPERALERCFRDLRLLRAADMIARYAALSLEDRQATLQESLPKWLALPAVRYRYITLALLINLPGNAFLGGGGGLMLASGLSRLFQPGKTILTLAIAILPFPVGFWLFGDAVLGAPF